jgi:hypothetical protein
MEGIGARKSEYERLKLQKALENFRYRDDKRLGNAVRRPFSRGSDVLHHRARGCVLARTCRVQYRMASSLGSAGRQRVRISCLPGPIWEYCSEPVGFSYREVDK